MNLKQYIEMRLDKIDYLLQAIAYFVWEEVRAFTEVFKNE